MYKISRSCGLRLNLGLSAFGLRVGIAGLGIASLGVAGLGISDACAGPNRTAIPKETHYARIISLAPVLSEWSAEILGKSEIEKSLIAVSEYSIYPTYLAKIPTIGAYFKLNIEKIAELKPDLILASSEYNRAEQLEQLSRLHLPVQIMPAEKFSQMPAWIEKLGVILHAEGGASEVIRRWDFEISALRTQHKEPSRSMFLEVQHRPMVTIGSSSFLNEAFALIGFANIFKDLVQSYPKVSEETVLQKKPQTIFILNLTGNAKDFADAESEWKKFGMKVVILPGDDFARCSFPLLKGLKSL